MEEALNSWGTAPYELNHPSPGGIAIVGRDPGEKEVREGRPFVEYAPAGRVLRDCMTEAGIPRASVNLLNVSRRRPPGNKFEAHPRASLEVEVAHLHKTLQRLRPALIVALGNEAAHALVPDWPDATRPHEGLVHTRNIKGARDIESRRGYLFDSPFGPVLTTVHPAAAARVWVPWRMLLSFDLQRAKELHTNGFVRPTRDVQIVSSDSDARRAVEHLRRFRILGTDIETRGGGTLACIGFAGESGEAYVFPAQYLDRASELLSDPKLRTVWANGIYDLFVLRHRRGVDVRTPLEDVQIAWHAAYPELAGQKEDPKKSRHTRKSLSFLASLSTWDPWWKGDYETEEEFFIYNGKDCCITLDVHEWVQGVVDEVGARSTYEHEMALVWPCVDMLERGLRVDDDLRQRRIKALEENISDVFARANEVVIPLVERERERLSDVIHLFEETDPTCECCRHGEKKQMACWACAGFDRAPTKKMLVEKYGKVLTEGKNKAECEELLPICHVCEGAPRETRLVFNPNSNTQAQVILYDILRLPKRFKRNAKGKSVLTTDEEALKSILGVISDA